MRAGDTVQAALAALSADAGLLAVLNGPHVYRSGTRRQRRVPSVEWMIVSSPLRESTQRVTVQFDQYGVTYSQVMQIEARMFAVLHHENRVATIGGLRMLARYDDGRDHPDDAAEGEVRRSVDFVFEPAKEG